MHFQSAITNCIEVLFANMLFQFSHFHPLQQKQIQRRSIIIVEDYDTKEIKDVVNCEDTDR